MTRNAVRNFMRKQLVDGMVPEPQAQLEVAADGKN
jgi:hypothetical protein